ncbi:hypothetical protein NECAME_09515 [Necator americanus]|uniref:guanylate cyclase n=1 Tax=Necator americanus TaxID=51031 RepID=W2TCY8_NECAM|nr:hypothetical protein NECAME_09515 [Necator americanus]ETN79905.1 hypothetical protein NECAME_09515 [Necator americanus]
MLKGMAYIHQSFISFVGTLTSATCLVSQGWQVKLSSYGLSVLFDEKQQRERKRIPDLLWTAPELLRHPTKKPSKQTDVYSFAIICSEIITRRPAWDLAEREEKVDELLYKIKRGGPIPTRPKLTNPESLVEQALVENQSRELVEEKKKADILLGKMLPRCLNIVITISHSPFYHIVVDIDLSNVAVIRQVAERLKLGQSVQPEGFDNVTVLFSDIVRFTQLSAKCMPLQLLQIFLYDLLWIKADGNRDMIQV